MRCQDQKQMEPLCLVTFVAKGFMLCQPIGFRRDPPPRSTAAELQAPGRAGGRGVLVAVFQQWPLPATPSPQSTSILLLPTRLAAAASSHLHTGLLGTRLRGA